MRASPTWDLCAPAAQLSEEFHDIAAASNVIAASHHRALLTHLRLPDISGWIVKVKVTKRLSRNQPTYQWVNVFQFSHIDHQREAVNTWYSGHISRYWCPVSIFLNFANLSCQGILELGSRLWRTLRVKGTVLVPRMLKTISFSWNFSWPASTLSQRPRSRWFKFSTWESRTEP